MNKHQNFHLEHHLLRSFGISFICFFLFSLSLNTPWVKAQSGSTPQIITDLNQKDKSGGSIQIEQPPQLNEIFVKNTENKLHQKGIPGFRIRIFSQTGQTARQKAIEIRTDFIKNFPGIESYMRYDEPYFKIVVGNFRSKNDALRKRKEIEQRFPNAFIINEMVTLQ